jgi:3-oxoacyl-[acyl-carrier protein] reductase
LADFLGDEHRIYRDENISKIEEETMDLGLEGKVALITGAGSPIGFGRGIALVLAGEGCDIVVNDIDYGNAQKTAAEVEALGRKAMAIKADVTNSAEVRDMVKEALAKFGKIDILVNNAGATNPVQPFVETPESVWNKIIDLNLRGTMNCAQAVLSHMLSRKSGRIINISSGAGLSGTPHMAAYGAAKAGVMAFTKGLSREVISSGIHVNNIAPGLGDTNFIRIPGFPPDMVERVLTMVPSGKVTTPEDLGHMIAYLSSDLSNQIVGQTILVDGGHQHL